MGSSLNCFLVTLLADFRHISLAPLEVGSRSKADGSFCSFCHCVCPVVVLMGFDVRSEWDLAIFLKIQCGSSRDCPWAGCLGNSAQVGGAFSHNTMYCIISTITRDGSLLNGRVLLISLMRSLITLIWRSLSGTCSLVAVVLRFSSGILSLRHSDYLSMRAVSILNQHRWYMRNIYLHELTSIGCFRPGKYSTVVNFIFLEILTMNG
jgi:hypothetical protein